MNSTLHSNSTSAHDGIVEYSATHVTENPTVNSLPSLPPDITLLIVFCVVVIAWVTHTALEAGGVVSLKIGDNAFHAQGNQPNPSEPESSLGKHVHEPYEDVES